MLHVVGGRLEQNDMYGSVLYCLKLGLLKVRLTAFVHLRFTLHHVVTLHISTFQFVMYSGSLISAPEMHKLMSMCR